MSAGRKARGGVAFHVAPDPPPAAPQCFACVLALSVLAWFVVIFGGLHLIARFLP